MYRQGLTSISIPQSIYVQLVQQITANPSAFAQYGITAESTSEEIQTVATQLAQGTWENSMKTNHTGEFALYINPGALDKTPNLNIKHFLMLFGAPVATTSAN